MRINNTFEEIKHHPFESINVFELGQKKPIQALISNVEYSAKNYPETFHIPSLEVRKNIPVGMMVKIIVDWKKKFLMTERFWVEVTERKKDLNGAICYFGIVKNDTLVASYDTPIGPFYPRHICDLDLDRFLKKHHQPLAA